MWSNKDLSPSKRDDNNNTFSTIKEIDKVVSEKMTSSGLDRTHASITTNKQISNA